MRINVNPETQSGGFDYVAAGRYEMRVEAIEQKTGKNSGLPYLNIRLAHVDANLVGEKGNKVGGVFAICSLKEDAQWKLRKFVEATGQEWGDFDTEEMIGTTVAVQLDVETDNNDELRNVVKKFIKS